MTILFFTRLFYPHIGGVETHVLEVGKRLVEKGHRVIVVTEQLPKTHSFDYQSEALGAIMAGKVLGMEVYHISTGKSEFLKKFKIWQWLFSHKTLIQQADIVHCHDVFFWYLPFRFLYPSKKVYTTFHGYETVIPPTKQAIAIRKLSEKLSFGNICVGEFITKWYGTKADYITYGGIDDSRFKIQDSRFKKKTLNILFIGRLEKDTGVILYIDVLKKLKEKKIEFVLNVCGDGPLKKEIEQYGKVLGFVPELSTYLKESNVVFASSYLSMLQAFAYKKPVIAMYDNPLKRDYLTVAPFAHWIMASNSPLYVAEQIPTIDKVMTNGVKMAYDWVKGQTWDALTEKYLVLWKAKKMQ